MNNNELILETLAKTGGGSLDSLNKLTKISTLELKKVLMELIEEQKVYYKEKFYHLRKKGIITIKTQGNGFISVPDDNQSYYVYPEYTNDAYTNDEVDFYIPFPDSKNRFSANVISIVTRGNPYVIGKLVQKKKKDSLTYSVISHDKDFEVRGRVNPNELNGAVEGSIVKAKVKKYLKNSIVDVEIEKVIGHCDDPGIEIAEIAEKYGFDAEFPEEVVKEASKIPTKVKLTDYPNRRDFTDTVTITIDGDDSKDFDDAISLKTLENGNYELGVYIADVSEYVKENSKLDLEALSRGTSVYLADRVIPMIPHKLSNGICSLVEDQNRLVLACIMEIDLKGTVVSYDISEGIICSKRRMTYNNINKILDGNLTIINKYPDISTMVLMMSKLSEIIRQKRTRKGALDFDSSEYKITLDNRGIVKEVNLRTTGKGERLIEDFMLSANETVAYHLNIMKLPCCYRVHEKPDSEKIEAVFSTIRNLGFNLRENQNKTYAKAIQQAMLLVKDSKENSLINQLMLRSMMKAKYDPKCLGHFGLAMKHYCHFTSPIRRYPDLMVHRIIKECLLHSTNLKEKINHFTEVLPDICQQSSIQERKSIECEYEVNDTLIANYMSQFTRHEFTGVISSVLSFGIFVTLPNGIEGLIHVSDMDGFYTLDEKKLTLSCDNRVFRIGDVVSVICVGSSRKERKVNFMLKENFIDYFGEWYIHENSGK